MTQHTLYQTASHCNTLQCAATHQGVPEGKGRFVTKLGRGELVYEGELMQVFLVSFCL